MPMARRTWLASSEPEEQADPDEALRRDIACALAEGEPASAIAKRLSQRYSRRKREVYELVLSIQQN